MKLWKTIIITNLIILTSLASFAQSDLNLGLPPVPVKNAVSLTVLYDSEHLISSKDSFSPLGLTQALKSKLGELGLSKNLNNYKIKSLSFRAKGEGLRGQVRLCTYGNISIQCLEVISQYNMQSDSEEFLDNGVWFSYPLFTGISGRDIGTNIDIEYIGQIKIDSIHAVMEVSTSK